MSKVAKSDWSASTPWSGITDKPASFGASDIGQLTGAGFGVGQVPRWNGSRFVPYTIPSSVTPPPTPSPFPPQFTLTWDIPLLNPLQTASQSFNVSGVFPNFPIAIAWNTDPGFFLFSGLVTDIEIITLYAANMDAAPITFGEITVTIQRFS